MELILPIETFIKQFIFSLTMVKLKLNPRQDSTTKIISLSTKDNKIVEMKLRKLVRTLGKSGYVSVPKELIGKAVEISFNSKILKGGNKSG